jgi:hypothetical protein
MPDTAHQPAAAGALELLGAADRCANELRDDDAGRHQYDHGINVRAAERYVATVRRYGAVGDNAARRAAGDRLAHRAVHHLAELDPDEWTGELTHWHARYGCNAEELDG